MFFCEECRIKQGWPGGLLGPRSRGPCELCKKTTVCHDVPSSALLRSKPASTRELREPPEPERPKPKSAWERLKED